MSDGPTTDELIAQVPLFAGLSKKELKQISSLATRLDLPAGKELTHQGKTGQEFLVVLKGDVDVVIDGKVVATKGAGDFFGEIALLEGSTRTATVVASTPLRLIVMSAQEFRRMEQELPAVADRVRAAVRARLDS